VQYVVASITTFLKENKIELDLKVIDNMIESLIDLTKEIN